MPVLYYNVFPIYIIVANFTFLLSSFVICKRNRPTDIRYRTVPDTGMVPVPYDESQTVPGSISYVSVRESRTLRTGMTVRCGMASYRTVRSYGSERYGTVTVSTVYV